MMALLCHVGIKLFRVAGGAVDMPARNKCGCVRVKARRFVFLLLLVVIQRPPKKMS